ncbi:glycosyltransferase family 8 protein [Helicobacter sp. MIT 99-5507]|nr:glycosyltransferase family 8 protein [Helicobacter sp. MIT 99-5507]RDU58682.1 glycosyltransferase family 8 protein [Helicobacter sp. MIT 99-5507]
MKIIPIMFCFDKNYCIPASIAFISLLCNTAKYGTMGGGKIRI